MVGTRRSAPEIMREILAANESSHTGIRYAVNVNFYQSSKYLAFLRDRGFVHERRTPTGRMVYSVSPKGQGLLGKLNKLLELLGSPS